MVRSIADMSELSQPSDPRRVSDESIQPNHDDPRAVALDSGGGTGRTADVDQMVSSFLSELEVLSDALQRSPGKPTHENGNSSAPTGVPEGLGILKAASYRNIDVLLMDNARSSSGGKRPQDDFAQ